ncbi:Hypothetical predicted protein [Paramuricea clavata]|uniref:Uncharacterized protein n=1 Tax=Paramuricea clavata TaxID=317549 RepID=A0A6S7GDT4_PARCT|nr:Hypothetical predicted protein [Paramuricea clavata]
MVASQEILSSLCLPNSSSKSGNENDQIDRLSSRNNLLVVRGPRLSWKGHIEELLRVVFEADGEMEITRSIKKWRFRGQTRWDVDTTNSNNSNLSSPRVSTPVLETACVRKVTSQSNERSDDFDGAHSYRLIELSNLVSAFQSLDNCQSGAFEMTVTAKPMEISGILTVAARIVRTGKIWISGRKSTRNGASQRNEVWKESHESGKAECARVSKISFYPCSNASVYSLLLRCLPGYSQNADESLNSLVWKKITRGWQIRGMFNDVDPLDFDPSSSSSSDDDVEDDFDDEDDYPLARFAHNDESDDSDDALLAQFASREQEK